METITALESARRRLEGTGGYRNLVNSSFRDAGLVFPERWYQAAWERWRTDPAYRADSRGGATAREAVARWYRRDHAPVDPEDVLLTAGSSVSYLMLFTALRRQGAGAVALPQPGYPLFEEIAAAAGLTPQWYHLEADQGFDLHARHLIASLQVATRGESGPAGPLGAVVLISPNNPSGADYDPHQIELVAEFCREREILLIIDEVFSAFRQGAAPPPLSSSPAPPHPPGRPAGAFLLNGLSKLCAAPELKAGWIAAVHPNSRENAILDEVDLLHDTYLTLSGLGESAITTFLSEEARGDREALAAEVKAMRHRTRSSLVQLPGLRDLPPFHLTTPATPATGNGGIHLLFRLDAEFCAERFGTVDDEQIAIQLLQRHRLYLHPGYLYGITQQKSIDPWFVITVLHREDTWREMEGRLREALGG